jgi:uncharacterized protein involved in exopolysaccharide biosynthesis
MFGGFWRMVLMKLPVGFLTGLGVAAVVTYAMPKKYESVAVVELKWLPAAFEKVPLTEVLPQRSGEGEGEAPAWVVDEIGRMTGGEALDRVSKRLDLEKRWNLEPGEVRAVLEEAVLAQSIRGTDLVSVRVRHTSKVDARDIAAEVVRDYKEVRSEIKQRDAELQLRELNRAVKEQEDKVESLRQALLQVREESGQESGEFSEAERGFVTEQDFLQTMKLKQMGETIAAKIPGEVVVLHESPEIPEAPVWPNVTLNLVAGAALGLLLAPLMALGALWGRAR